MRIAVQGVPGCFSEQAALQLRPQAEILHCADFSAMFTALVSGTAAASASGATAVVTVEAAIVPIENTLAGMVEETAVLLRQYQDQIQVDSEVQLQIELCLMLHPSAAMTGVREVLSHPVALRQCKKFLAQWPAWRVTSFFDTAGSVAEAMRRGAAGQLDTAAVASPRAAAVYGARIAQRGIGDANANFTRFFLVTAPAASVLPREGRGEGSAAS